ncbi:hypothetical protein [Sunxiuqinia dokdonensis]|uniref:DUF559 domain-containing protein n=1 Tax=Sunxiuqinia dokdonensis TaxID=1409788 RepID=A0A0L8V9U4_9BACT|nr:hypothetical protein [Sunxiuqinia dokdonensis]KOH44982.1 hypothetical protein NC99_21070 [Sunxiuqinia dokdonensis]
MEFPIAKIPQGLMNIRNKHIELPFVLPKPEKPVETPSYYTSWWFVFFSFLVIVIGSSNNSDGTIQYGLILLLFGLVWRWIESSNNKKNRKEYNEKLVEYNKSMSSYNEQIEEFTKILHIKNDLVLNHLYLFEQREDFFEKVKKPNCTVQVKKGVSEKYFLQFLQKYFPDEIFCDRGVILEDSFVSPYIPDFIFFDTDRNYLIDIEIDEPYSFESREPIHFRTKDNFTSDTRRDVFFLSCNWIVVRFSEEQIIKNPVGCCFYLAIIISVYFEEDKYKQRFKEIPDILKTKVWDYSEAKIKSKGLYREKLLLQIGVDIKLSQAIKNTISERDDDEDDLPF